MVASGSISLIIFSCTEEPQNNETETQTETPVVKPDLSDAIQKRVEKKPEEAVLLLRTLNKNFPDSPAILIQLSRALADSGQYPLAAFRVEQAISAGSDKGLLLECAEIYQLAGDLDSAQERFKEYLIAFPENLNAWQKYARTLISNGNETEALNAFEKANTLANPEDCLIVADLYTKKEIYVKAEYWFRESMQRESKPSVLPLLGLLRIKFLMGDEGAAEALILAIEKSFPNELNNDSRQEEYSSLIIRRRLAEFGKREVVVQNLSISELAQELLSEPKKIIPPVISSGPKLSPTLSDPVYIEETDSEVVEISDKPIGTQTSLAEAFSIDNSQLIKPSSLELGWSSFLSGNYSDALLHARDSIKLNSKDSEAWRLTSQAHFQLGEIREAEMTILEAIRHNPIDLKTRMDYLNIARETLSPTRYLRELEKTHERFPDSGEILWQLARRYHTIERMPVTAGILYRKLLTIVPKGSALYYQAEMELIKIQNL